MEIIRAPRRDSVIQIIRAEDKMKDATTSAAIALLTTVAIALIGFAKCYTISPTFEKELIMKTVEMFSLVAGGAVIPTLVLGIREVRLTNKANEIKERVLEKMAIKPLKKETENQLEARKRKALNSIVKKARKGLDGDVEFDISYGPDEELEENGRSKN